MEDNLGEPLPKKKGRKPRRQNEKEIMYDYASEIER
jgi:hypothetical protein